MKWTPPHLILNGEMQTLDQQKAHWHKQGMGLIDFVRFWDMAKIVAYVMPCRPEESYAFVKSRLWEHWRPTLTYTETLNRLEADLNDRELLTPILPYGWEV